MNLRNIYGFFIIFDNCCHVGFRGNIVKLNYSTIIDVPTYNILLYIIYYYIIIYILYIIMLYYFLGCGRAAEHGARPADPSHVRQAEREN